MWRPGAGRPPARRYRGDGPRRGRHLYAWDQSRFTDHTLPLAVLMPRTTAEVSRCLQVLHELAVAVVPRGGGLSGAAKATAGSVGLSLHRMNEILELDLPDRLAVVQPG